MSLLLLLGIALPGWLAAAAALALILLLGFVSGVLYLRLVVVDSERYEAVAERDQLRATVQTMHEMSRTHAETVARMAAIAGKKNKKGR